MSWKLVDEPKGRVVLYYPKLWEPQWPMWAPLDMFAIATAMLHAGYEVVFLDERLDPDPRHWLKVALPGSVFVGISGKFGEQGRHMVEIARYCKEHAPEVPVVAGGWLASLFPEQVLSCPDIDVVIEGPADFSAPAVADCLREGRSPEGIAGAWWKEGGETKGSSFGHLPKITDTHPVAWDTVNIARYLHPNGWINYFSSRGCPGGCTFCAIYCLDPHRWTALPAERVLADWEELYRLGARAFKVMDTDFLAHQRRTDEICREVLRRGLKIRFDVLGRHLNMARMSDDQIALLRNAGCTEIEMGVESGSQRLADMIDKQLDLEEVPRTIRRFVENGIRVKVNIMFGLPTETEEDLRANFELLYELEKLGDGARLQCFRFTPLPDAPLNKQVYTLKQRGHDGSRPESLDELLALPINDEPEHMFWLPRRHEQDVKRSFYFYGALSLYKHAIDSAEGRPIWKWMLKRFRKMARWRTRTGYYRFPVEMWLNSWFGNPLPRGDEDGVGPPEEDLPVPPLPMGETLNLRPPLQPTEKVAEAAGSTLERPEGPLRQFWIQ